MGMLDLEPDRARVVRDLEAAGIEVTAWLLLDRENGYWLNADNSDLAMNRYASLHAWSRREDLKLWRIGLDIEPPRDHLDDMLERPIEGVVERLQMRREAGAVENAELAYAKLVDLARRDGRSVESYQFPFIVDERLTESSLLRRSLGIVDVPVDAEVLMLYRSYIGPEGCRAYFEDADMIALGVTGGGVHADNPELEPKIGWDELREDMLAAARHTQEVYIFSLEGCVEQGMLPLIRDLDWSQEPTEIKSTHMDRARRGRRVVQWAARGEQLLDLLFPAKKTEPPPALAPADAATGTGRGPGRGKSEG
jgi:hypothetical protein